MASKLSSTHLACYFLQVLSRGSPLSLPLAFWPSTSSAEAQRPSSLGDPESSTVPHSSCVMILQSPPKLPYLVGNIICSEIPSLPHVYFASFLKLKRHRCRTYRLRKCTVPRDEFMWVNSPWWSGKTSHSLTFCWPLPFLFPLVHDGFFCSLLQSPAPFCFYPASHA